MIRPIVEVHPCMQCFASSVTRESGNSFAEVSSNVVEAVSNLSEVVGLSLGIAVEDSHHRIGRWRPT